MADQQEPHHLTCACKGVELEVRGTPLFQSSCWCSSCTVYHQMSPVPNVMFKSDDVTVTKGEDLLKRFSVRMPNMGRYFCTVRHMAQPLTAQRCSWWTQVHPYRNRLTFVCAAC